MNKLILAIKDFKKMPYSDTDVHWTKTKGEIEGILFSLRDKGVLKKHGWLTEGSGDDIIETLVLELEIPVSDTQTRTLQLRFQPTMIYTEHWKGSMKRGDKHLEKRVRRNTSWRLFFWIFKAKMEAVQYGLVTLQNEFMSNIILPIEDKTITFGEALTTILQEDRLGSLLEDRRDRKDVET